MQVSFKELMDAFEFAGFGSELGEFSAYICKKSGKIYCRSSLLDDSEQELPDDIEDEEKYLPIPGKRELDLGKPLVLDFARQVLPGDFDEVRSMFSRRGAYGAFKNLLGRRHAIDRWHDFENKATERALREWCADNLIELAD